ncbi:MAG: ABC transporter permease [Candidatus Paceibacterota bacterium]
MKFKYTLQTALKALRTHASRSVLTILGIVIGVAAIIVVMSIGGSAQVLILDQISGMGPETVVVRPGGGLSDITGTLFASSLKQSDIEDIKKSGNVPNLVQAEPNVVVGENIEYKGKKYRPMVMGVSIEFMSDMFDLKMAEGFKYDKSDIESNARVIVLGDEIKREIFENRNAIGEQITIKDVKFKIVGILEDMPPIAGFNLGEAVMIPQTTALTYLTGGDYYNELIVVGDSPANVEKMAFDIETTLRESHKLDPGEDNDFTVQTQEEAIDQIQSIIAILTAFLSVVVAVSLVVGGIGIMNIMLVSVTERTKEIGLRKALGAHRADILKQFLLEAVILTSIGGIVGIILGALISFVASIILAQFVDESWRFTLPLIAILLGVGVSSSVGLIFGIYPASQASKKSPIEALQYE